MSTKKAPRPKEIAVIGDVEDWEEDVVKELLELEPGRACTLYVDSGGGSVTGALAAVTLLRHRRLQATAIVLGECSSASLLLFAACTRRIVTPYSIFLFHSIRWQSDKRLIAGEALEWARHFHTLETDMDNLQFRLFGKAEDQVRAWTAAGKYVTGAQMAEAGLAELMEL
jgi:ATP-dependent protease ClpP protease subunit